MKMDEKGIGTALIVVIVVAVIVVAVAVPAVILLKPGEGPAPGGPTTTPTTTPPITTTPLTTTTPTTTTTPWTAAQGLQIALKDQGMPEVKFLQPTIIEIQLQLENGDWKTIWSDPNGIKLTLTPGEREDIFTRGATWTRSIPRSHPITSFLLCGRKTLSTAEAVERFYTILRCTH